MYHEHLRQRTQRLLSDYTQLVGQIFPGVVATDEFVNCFNQFFTEYQTQRKLKLAPTSIKEGKISCTSAVAIMGVWYWLQTQLQPDYYIDFIHPLSGQSRTSSHSLINIPQTGSVLTLFHYTLSNKLCSATTAELDGTYQVGGNAPFLHDRLKVFPVTSAHFLPKSNP